MHFEIDETHPDISPVGSVMSWREGVLLSIIVHLLFVIAAVRAPHWFAVDPEIARQQEAKLQQARQEARENPRFVFVQPKIDRKAARPPERAELSDVDRQAKSPQSAPQPVSTQQ